MPLFILTRDSRGGFGPSTGIRCPGKGVGGLCSSPLSSQVVQEKSMTRNDPYRNSGDSVQHVRGSSHWRPSRNPRTLNGPVIVHKPAGGVASVVPTPHVQLDSKRYADQSLRLKVMARDDCCCRYCGIFVTDSEANIDHVIPWRDGGQTVIENLVTSCRRCNRLKGNGRWKPKQLGRRMGSNG